ncbi:MAG TPA: response regulator [Acidisarcina sp.]
MPFAVLLVDDNAVQAATRRAILSRAGNEVTVASSAASALLAMERNDFLASLGLVVTDHLMPGMNGPEFVRGLREFAPKLPVLVISGLGEAELEYEGLDVLFRVKPFPPEQLISLVRSILDGPISLTA